MLKPSYRIRFFLENNNVTKLSLPLNEEIVLLYLFFIKTASGIFTNLSVTKVFILKHK
jgi:hypothetical protein